MLKNHFANRAIGTFVALWVSGCTATKPPTPASDTVIDGVNFLMSREEVIAKLGELVATTRKEMDTLTFPSQSDHRYVVVCQFSDNHLLNVSGKTLVIGKNKLDCTLTSAQISNFLGPPISSDEQREPGEEHFTDYEYQPPTGFRELRATVQEDKAVLYTLKR